MFAKLFGVKAPFSSLLLLGLFYQSTPSCLKVMGWGGVGGPCDFRFSQPKVQILSFPLFWGTFI